MYLKFNLRRKLLVYGLASVAVLPLSVFAAAQHDGSSAQPLRVILVPADGGTEDGTKKDFVPIFNAITRATGLKFDIKVGQSYGAVMEAQCAGAADIAFYGPASYLPVHRKGCANLLALAVKHNESVYYSGLFARTDAGIDTIKDVKGKRLALGDLNSTSSFAVPVAMMIDGGVNPSQEAGAINLAGSHANVLKALAEGVADIGGASFDSYEKAVNQKAIDPTKIKVIKKSAPIPYPPLAIHPGVPAKVQAQLRDAFERVHELPGVTPDQIRGYGGAKVDRYTTKVSEEEMAAAAKMFALVTDQIKQDIIKKASAR